MNAQLLQVSSLIAATEQFSGVEIKYVLLASALMAVATTLFGWALASILWGKRREFADDFFERTRREKLRSSSTLYRQFEPLLDDFSQSFDKKGGAADKIRDKLPLLPGNLPWKAHDYLATKTMEGILVAAAAFLLLVWFIGPIVAAIVAIFLVFGYLELCKAQVTSLAAKRLKAFKKRLPFVVDLQALMMQAGAGFQESLKTIVMDNRENPVGEEFGEVLRDIELGQSRREALEKLHARIDDDDVRELIFAIIKGEELGTPLSQIFRNQADQMRLKRSQWAEKAAADAQVKMVFPGIVIMMACLLVVISPFLMKIVNLLFG